MKPTPHKAIHKVVNPEEGECPICREDTMLEFFDSEIDFYFCKECVGLVRAADDVLNATEGLCRPAKLT